MDPIFTSKQMDGRVQEKKKRVQINVAEGKAEALQIICEALSHKQGELLFIYLFILLYINHLEGLDGARLEEVSGFKYLGCFK